MEPFLGEIKLLPYEWAPRNWALCNGQLLPIRQNQALFALLGNAFGGDPAVTFALPDLRDRAALGAGESREGRQYSVGATGGEEQHALTLAELPWHNHRLLASKLDGDTQAPAGHVPAQTEHELYAPPDNVVALAPAAVTTTGGSRPHSNMPPYLTVSFVICLNGIFPSRG